MAIKRYYSDADNTITKAFRSNLITRGTGANMGASDILEVFSIYAQATTSSVEAARILIKFPVDSISADRTNGDIPASGSVDFYLRLYNAKHSQTLPRKFDLVAVAVSQSWEEGFGLDMESFSDLTYDETGSNWENRGSTGRWDSSGGDYVSGSYTNSSGVLQDNLAFTASFDNGDEDMELDVTPLVEEWIAGNLSNYGFGVALTDDEESDSRSFYTKKFFSRSSEYFFKRPTLEARWDSATKDDRGNFYYSSSLAPAADNLNTLYLYNYVRGQLKNIPAVDEGAIYVALYSGSSGVPSGAELTLSGDSTSAAGAVASTYATGGYVSKGIYSASICLTASANDAAYDRLYDVWFSGDPPARSHYFTGSIVPKSLEASNYNRVSKQVTTISNLKDSYNVSEKSARFRVHVRDHDWQPNIYTVAKATLDNNTVEDSYYRVYRLIDNMEIVGYGTGSNTTVPQAIDNAESYTRMSFDVSGNYFDLDMSMFEPGYAYGLQFVYYLGGRFVQQEERFKFRVEE